MQETLSTADHRETPGDVPSSVGEGGRYRLLHQLGAGGFGTVYKARDTQHGGAVAVKFLHGRSPAMLYRFKREFRSLADLDHPNLVRLYELSSEAWFVVMEFVDGVGLLQHLAPSDRSRPTVTVDDADGSAAPAAAAFERVARPDPSRVRATFAQLARGLAALHGEQKLHRDVKPSNVMVTRDGRVVLLDFGLVAEASGELHALLAPRAGTPAYMAPEQVEGRALGPSCDWYALGATLHEVLTGQPPIGRPSLDLDGPDVDAAERDLRALCARLLDPDPSRRPRGDEVIAALDPGRPAEPASTPAGAAPIAIVGREREIAVLDGALDAARGGAVLARVEGASGVGKTALVEAWLGGGAVEAAGAWVLRSRCFEHEHVPFKAIDGIVDSLAARMLSQPLAVRERLLGDAAPLLAAAARMFPVLGELRTSGPDAAPVAGDAEATSLRDHALDALRDLFARLASRQPLVLVIDDAHWGDADSAGAVARILHPASRGLAVAIVQRAVEEPTAFPNVLFELLGRDAGGVSVRSVLVSDLAEAEALDLARACVGDRASELAARIHREAGGNPFLIRQLATEIEVSLAHGGAPDPADVVAAALVTRQVARLPEYARRLVETLSLAARPLPEAVATNAARVDPGEAIEAIRTAERHRLVVSSRYGGRRCIEALHARVRDSVARAIAPDAARSHHRAIADAIIADGHAEPEALLPHFLGAGDDARASDAAGEAADKAERVFAFGRAAELYEIVLRLRPEPARRTAVLELRGRALANAGRSADAAAVLEDALKAREDATPSERRGRIELQQQVARLWLQSGYVERGSVHLDAAMAARGLPLPRSESEALRLSLLRRLRLLVRGLDFQPRDPSSIDPAALERLDTLWAAYSSIGVLRFMIGDAVALQHLLEALEVGDAPRIFRSLAVEASFAALLGGPFFGRRCDRIHALMERHASAADGPAMRAWAVMSRGVTSWSRGDWGPAWRWCSEAATLYEAQPRSHMWELAICDIYGLSAATYLGRFRELRERVPASHRAARERGDLYATANLAFFESFLLLAADDPEASIRCSAESARPFMHDPLLSNRYGIAYAIAQGELYRENPAGAWAIVERDWPAWETTGMLRACGVRMEVRYLRARAAVALLSTLPRRGLLPSRTEWRARRALAADERALGGENIAPARALQLALRASREKLAGRSEAAAETLSRAGQAFAGCGMAVHAAAARHHLAGITHRAVDVDAAVAGRDALAADGVVRPERMFRLAIPGFG